MSESLFKKLLGVGKSERRATKSLTRGEIRGRQETGQWWDYFRTDMRHYLTGAKEKASGNLSSLGMEIAEVGWAETFPELPMLIENAVAAARARGRKVVMVDLLGEADGASLGADVTVCLALSRHVEDSPTHKLVTGNAVQKGPQKDLFKVLDTEDGDIAYWNFSPIGGFAPEYAVDGPKEYTPEEQYTGGRLLELFDGIYERAPSPSVGSIQLSGKVGAAVDILTPHLMKDFLSMLEQRGIKHTFEPRLGRLLVLK